MLGGNLGSLLYGDVSVMTISKLFHIEFESVLTISFQFNFMNLTICLFCIYCVLVLHFCI